MTSPDTLPRGLCIHCHSRVKPGKDGFVRPGGQLAHRRCRRRVVQAERAEERREYYVLAAVYVALVVFLVALALAVPA